MLETPDYPRDPAQERRIPAEALREFLAAAFTRKGMYAFEARIVADRLVEADQRGTYSHGSRTAARYMTAMDAGHIDPRGTITTIRKTPAMAVLHGGRNVGHLAATRAMQLAVQMAREVGTGTVAVQGSQHFGAAALYALIAVEAGMIGYCTTSTGPATVAAYGSRAPATANNACAWGVPVRSGAPFVLDMACAVSSWGKVHAQLMYGGTIPAGWALDAAGNPTTDAGAAKTLLPASGARGFGLAFLCSVLAGPLAGGRMPLQKTAAVEQEGSEHFFLALDVGKFCDREQFLTEVETVMNQIRSLPPEPGFDRVRLPGEPEWERAQQAEKQGIPLHRTHVAELEALAASLGIRVPW
jgi:LDH2 family malate/lactate/ureidoglycolate dehydrogenase